MRVLKGLKKSYIYLHITHYSSHLSIPPPVLVFLLCFPFCSSRLCSDAVRHRLLKVSSHLIEPILTFNSCFSSLSLDKLHTALSELCFSINYVPNLAVWEHTFTPREYLTSHLEIRFTK